MKNRLTTIFTFLFVLFAVFSAFFGMPGDETESIYDSMSIPTVEAQLSIDGKYSTMEDVALYIHTYGCLPRNYLSKADARALGWEGGNVEKYAPGWCIGGDVFGNYEGLLPEAEGRVYYECDINTLGKSHRGEERIVFSNDGLIYYTPDHYESFELLYGEE